MESAVFELGNFGPLEDGYLNFDTGYYLLLKPLKKGMHTIRISGESVFGPVDASYVINVYDGHDELENRPAVTNTAGRFVFHRH